MKQYLDMMRLVRETGVYKGDRTGVGCYSIFGHQMRFDLSDGSFPLVTTKKCHLRSIIHELLWFLNGDTNIRYLKENGVSIWDEWVLKGTEEYVDLTDEELTKALLKRFEETGATSIGTITPTDMEGILLDFAVEDGVVNFFLNDAAKIDATPLQETCRFYGVPTKRLVAGELGPVYGSQWRNWPVAQQSTVDALIELSCLGNGNRWGNSDGNCIAQKALLDIPGIVHNKQAYMSSGYSYEDWVKLTTKEKDITSTRGGIDQITQLVNSLKGNPDSRRHIVTAWNPLEVDYMALPPCFSKGTLVATPNGYVPIETISENDFVLSATGAVQRVNQLWVTPYKGQMVKLKVQGTGKSIRCTPNHPFLIKDKGYVDASDISVGDLLGIPKTKDGDYHSFTKELNHGSGSTTTKTVVLNNDDYYTLGYFLGNGWCGKNRNLISFAIPHKKYDSVLYRIRKTIKVSKKPGISDSVYTYETRSDLWIDLFREFGHGASNKKIPQWVMESSREAKQHFLEGFFDADGHFPKFGKVCVTTTSSSIAFGIQRLLIDDGLNCAVRFQKKNPIHVIEGRTVNQKDLWYLEGHIPINRSATLHDENYYWVPVKSKETYETDETVYNLDVDNEHTYMVNNLATHNCHCLYQFYTSPMVGMERWVYGLNHGYFEENEGRGQFGLDEFLDQKGVPTRKLSCQLYQRKLPCAFVA